jgi:hypothetical protein
LLSIFVLSLGGAEMISGQGISYPELFQQTQDYFECEIARVQGELEQLIIQLDDGETASIYRIKQEIKWKNSQLQVMRRFRDLYNEKFEQELDIMCSI